MSEVNYKDTLNLPETAFSMKANLTNKEPEFQEFWEDINIYEKIISKNKDSQKFILHDGPPYANGNIHIGHALNKILKDIIIKYKSMKGFNSPYVPGWDCHGLPIEHQVTKNLKDKANKSKLDIRKLCKEYAEKFIDIQKQQFKRLGIFGEWDNPYLTINHEYEAGILEVFKLLVQKGFVERRLKPIHWCLGCRTALAEAEVEYQDHSSPSVYVKFEVEDDLSDIFPEISGKKTSFLIWTTTPWTLPANLAIALNKKFSYAAVEVDGEVLILAKDLSEKVMQKKEINYKILAETTGAQLQGIKYKHPFMDRISPVILADFVTIEDGTGCVHIAPGHGEDDYKVGMQNNIGIFAPVNARGEFTNDVPEFIRGQKVFVANNIIVEKLEELGNLFNQENISHSYPHCWRCKKPVIFRATEQWFIGIDTNDLRQKVLGLIKKVKWIPSWGQARINAMIENRPDWCISRQRAWGVPIPVIYCEDCNTPILDESIIENLINLVKEHGCNVWFEKDINEIIPQNIICSCGSKRFIKENDILDVWFDSGVSHTSVLKQRENLSYPADLYLEGSDQHRGWFQSSLLTSTAVYEEAPYKTVLTHGFTVDGKGKKMSKSVGNVVDPLTIIKKSGADILRLWVSSCDYSEDVKVSDDILLQRVDAYRKIRNTCRFILGNTFDFDYNKDVVSYEDLLEIDKLALSKLYNLLKKIDFAYENYQFHKVFTEIYMFCTVEMSSFYLDILKDRLYTFGKKSLERCSAQTVMINILDVLTRIMTPILSFTSEELWKFMKPELKNQESVHLADWPEINEDYIDIELENTWKKLSNVRDDVLKKIEELRNSKVVGNSLESLVKISVADEELYNLLLKYEQELPTIFIVSKVILEKKEQGDLEITAEKVDAKKCLRCWNYRDSVGKYSEHPDICERCYGVVKDIKE